ncbi:hypothetical protein [uncultured Mediterranean phage uvDeep-CGR1-KM17-C101]|nr:hypothetical protein [uncultured Mediterranean phage uvDeep-CGR1-KM17-C101]
MNTIEYGQGAVNNTIGWGQGAKVGSSFSNTKSIALDGVDDFVDCGDNDNLSFGDGSSDSPFSISAWVKMDIVNNFIIVSKDATSQREYTFRMVNDTIRVFLLDNSSGGYIGRFYNSSLSSLQGVWSHFCFTYNGNSASNGVKIYLNATRVDDSNYQGGTYTAMENTLSNFNIGRQEISNLDGNGNIDEVSVFNSELSQSDITAIYGSGVPNSLSSYSSLLSWWRCGDNDTSPTLTDNGSGGNNGTMTNFSTFSTDVPT